MRSRAGVPARAERRVVLPGRLGRLDASAADAAPRAALPNLPFVGRARYEFVASDPGQLPLRRGDVVRVLSIGRDGVWAQGELVPSATTSAYGASAAADKVVDPGDRRGLFPIENIERTVLLAEREAVPVAPSAAGAESERARLELIDFLAESGLAPHSAALLGLGVITLEDMVVFITLEHLEDVGVPPIHAKRVMRSLGKLADKFAHPTVRDGLGKTLVKGGWATLINPHRAEAEAALVAANGGTAPTLGAGRSLGVHQPKLWLVRLITAHSLHCQLQLFVETRQASGVFVPTRVLFVERAYNLRFCEALQYDDELLAWQLSGTPPALEWQAAAGDAERELARRAKLEESVALEGEAESVCKAERDATCLAEPEVSINITSTAMAVKSNFSIRITLVLPAPPSGAASTKKKARDLLGAVREALVFGPALPRVTILSDAVVQTRIDRASLPNAGGAGGSGGDAYRSPPPPPVVGGVEVDAPSGERWITLPLRQLILMFDVVGPALMMKPESDLAWRTMTVEMMAHHIAQRIDAPETRTLVKSYAAATLLCVTHAAITRCVVLTNAEFKRKQRDAHEKLEDRFRMSRHKAVQLEAFMEEPRLPSLHAFEEGDFVWVRSLRFDHRKPAHETTNPSAHLGRVLRYAGDGRYDVQRMWAAPKKNEDEPTAYAQQIGSFLVQEQLLSRITTTIKFNVAKLAWLPRVPLTRPDPLRDFVSLPKLGDDAMIESRRQLYLLQSSATPSAAFAPAAARDAAAAAAAAAASAAVKPPRPMDHARGLPVAFAISVAVAPQNAAASRGCVLMLVVLQRRQAWQSGAAAAPREWEELGRTEPRVLPVQPGGSVATSTVAFALSLRVDAAASIQVLVINTSPAALAEVKAQQLHSARAVIADSEFLVSELLGAPTNRLEIGFAPADALRLAIANGAVEAKYQLPLWMPNIPAASRDTVGVLTVNALPNSSAMMLNTTQGGWGDGCFGWLRLSMEPTHSSDPRCAFASYVLNRRAPPPVKPLAPPPSATLARLFEVCAESPFVVDVARSFIAYRMQQARNTQRAFAKFRLTSDVHRRGSSVLASEFKRMKKLKKVKVCADALVALYEQSTVKLSEKYGVAVSSPFRSAEAIADQDARFVATNCHVQLVNTMSTEVDALGEAAEAALASRLPPPASSSDASGWSVLDSCSAAKDGAAAASKGLWWSVTMGAPSAVHTLGFESGGIRRIRAKALGGAPSEADEDPSSSVFDKFQNNGGAGFAMGGTINETSYALELRRDVVMAQMLGAVATAFAMDIATRCTDANWWTQIQSIGWLVMCESLLNASEHELAMLEDFSDAQGMLRRVGIRIRLPTARESDGVGWGVKVIPSRQWEVNKAAALRAATDDTSKPLSDKRIAEMWDRSVRDIEFELEICVGSEFDAALFPVELLRYEAPCIRIVPTLFTQALDGGDASNIQHDLNYAGVQNIRNYATQFTSLAERSPMEQSKEMAAATAAHALVFDIERSVASTTSGSVDVSLLQVRLCFLPFVSVSPPPLSLSRP